MRVMLVTLCLNEMEWLPKLVQQHEAWPGLCGWVFVEAADAVYAEANPELVRDGLSVDGTTEYLRTLPYVHVRHGLATHHDRAQGKCEARQKYLDIASGLRPDAVVVLDADEFYPEAEQARLNAELRYLPHRRALDMLQRHVWAPGDVPLFKYEARGAYWAVQHPRAFRWDDHLKYERNHNVPTGIVRHSLSSAVCVHMGFASKLHRAAKHAYYVARGEGVRDGRRMYVECRRAFEAWKEGDPMPHGARAVPYSGPVPEVFAHDSHPVRADQLEAT